MATVDIKNWDEKNTGSVSDLSDSSGFTGLQKVQPVKVTEGTGSGTGDAQFSSSAWSNISSKNDIVVTESDETTTRPYKIESLDTSNNVAWIWVYGSWDSDDSDQIVIGAGSGDGTDHSMDGDGSNPFQQNQNCNLCLLNPVAGNDLSSNGFSTTNNNCSTVDGMMGDATDHPGGTGDRVNIDGSDDDLQHFIQSNPNGTMAIWENPDNLPTSGNESDRSLVAGAGGDITSADAEAMLMHIPEDPPTIFWRVSDSDSTVLSLKKQISTSAENQWNSAVGIIDDGNGNGEIYWNGSELGSDSHTDGGDISNYNSEFTVGAPGSGTNNEERALDGQTQAYRVYSDNKSHAWRVAEYDAAPAGGQVFFSWSGQITTGSLNGWNKYREIEVTEQSENQINDYPIVVTSIDIGSASSDSIRITDNNNNVIDHSHRDDGSGDYDVTFRVDAAANATETYKIHYDNSSASDISKQWEKVRWNFFDDFTEHTSSDPTDDPRWSGNSGGRWNLDTSNNLLEFTGGDNDPLNLVESTLHYPIKVEFTIGVEDDGEPKMVVDFDGDGSTDGKLWRLSDYHGELNIWDYTGSGKNSTSANPSSSLVRHIYTQDRDSTNAEVIRKSDDKSASISISNFGSETDGDYTLTGRGAFGSGGYWKFNYIKVRNFESSEPTSSVGSESSTSTTNSSTATFDTAVENLDSSLKATFDTVIKQLSLEEGASLDAAIRQTDLSENAVFDTVIEKPSDLTGSFDTALKKEDVSTTGSFGAALKTPDQDAGVSFDTTVQETGKTETASVDTALESTNESTASADTYIAYGQPGNFTAVIDGDIYTGVRNVEVETHLNELHTFEFDAFIEDDADRQKIQEGNEVLLFDGRKLAFQGELEDVNYDSTFEAECKGSGLKLELLKNKTPRKEYVNQPADDIIKDILGGNDEFSLGTVESAPVITIRVDHDNQLRAAAGVANAVGYDLHAYTKEDESFDNMYVDFVERKGSSSSVATLNIAEELRLVDRGKDNSVVANDITILGRGDGINQEEVRLFAATTHRTVTSQRIQAGDTTTLDVKDASQLGATGDEVYVRVGEEVLHANIQDSTTLDILGRAQDDYNGDSTEDGQHYEDIQVFLKENVTQGIGPFEPTRDKAESGSSIDRSGNIEDRDTDKTLVDRATVEKVCDNELKDRREPVFRVEVDLTDPRGLEDLGIDIGDQVTIKDLTAPDVSNDFRVVGIDYDRASAGEATTLHCANRPVRLVERLSEIERDRDTLNAHMQGSTNVDSQGFVDNASSDNPLLSRIYIPDDAVAVNKLNVIFSRESFKGYVKNTDHSHDLTVNHPEHSHDVTHPSHSHDVTVAENLNSTIALYDPGSTQDASSNTVSGTIEVIGPSSGSFKGNQAAIKIYNKSGSSDDYDWQLEDSNGNILASESNETIGDDAGRTWNIPLTENEVNNGETLTFKITDGVVGTDSSKGIQGGLYIILASRGSKTSSTSLGSNETSTKALGTTSSETTSDAGSPEYGVFKPVSENDVDVEVRVDGNLVTTETGVSVGQQISSPVDLDNDISEPVSGSWHKVELTPIERSVLDDFEDGDVSEWSGDIGNFSADDSDPISGSYSGKLVADSSDKNATVTSKDYGSSSDSIEFSLRIDNQVDGVANVDFVGVKPQDSNGNRVFRITFEQDGDVMWKGGGNFETVADDYWSAGEVVDVRIQFDEDDKSAEVFLDGDSKGTYDTSEDSWTEIVFRNDAGSSVDNFNEEITAYLDDLKRVKGGLCRLNASIYQKVFVESKL